MMTRLRQRSVAAVLTAICLAGLLLAACTPARTPASIPTSPGGKSQDAPSMMPVFKWDVPVSFDEMSNVKLFQADTAGITLTVHNVVLLGTKATVYFSTATSEDGQAAAAAGSRLPVALPVTARLGASGKSEGPDTSPATEIVELARLRNVVLAAATFELPKTSPSELSLEVPAMQTLVDRQPPGSLQGVWSVTVLKNRRPELPDRNFYYSVFPLGPDTVAYGAVSVSKGDGQGWLWTRMGKLATADHQIVDRGDLAAFRLQSAAQTETVYAVRHAAGRVERISLETYQAWVAPTLPGYVEKGDLAPDATHPPYVEGTPLPPDQERALEATREALRQTPGAPIEDIIKQFPPEEQTPHPALNPPTSTPRS